MAKTLSKQVLGSIEKVQPSKLKGVERLVFRGRINDATDPEAIPKIPIMKNNIKKVLAGKTLEKDFDPSIGCSIKRT